MGNRTCASQPVGLGAEDKFVTKVERGLGEWGGSGDWSWPPFLFAQEWVSLLGVAVG